MLDGDFRVKGMDGLRVVDASIFPKIPGFFLCLPVYIISEKAADAILGQSPDPYFAAPDAGGMHKIPPPPPPDSNEFFNFFFERHTC